MRALPISPEGAVLSSTVQACGAALADVRIALALLDAGVLHPVTPMPPVDDALWQLVVDALDGDRPDPPVERTTATAIPLIVGGRAAGVLLADRTGEPQPFTAAEAALLRVIALRVAAAAEAGRAQSVLTDLLAEFMSPDVATALLAGPAALGGENRDVTVLFADLVGFTTFAERSRPEAVVALLNRCYAAAVPAVVDHGGTVSAFIGDAIMALFGAPQHQPEHPLLAARAALALRDAAAAMAADHPDLPRVRIGVNTGIATVGTVGSPRRRVFTAIGDTVNVASRLEGVAAPGTIVIGPETYATIRSFAETRPLPPVTVKGRSAPLAVHELLGLRTGSDRLLGSRTVRLDPARLPRPGPGPGPGP